MSVLIRSSLPNNKLFVPSKYPTIFPSEIFEEMDRFFENLGMVNPHTDGLKLAKGFPKGDIFTEDGKLVIELALAGYSKEQLSVRVEEDVTLVVSAERQDGEDKTHRSLTRKSFQKRFPQIGKAWDVTSAEVTYKDGLLRIVIPPVSKSETIKELEIK